MSCYKCGWNHDPCEPCTVIVTSGCPIQLDFSCIFYHKSNNQPTNLIGLGLTNGATLQLFAETVDEKIKQLNVIDTDLPCLREGHVINTLQQFLTAVDTELCELQKWLGNIAEDPDAPDDGSYWYNTVEAELRIQLNGAAYTITTTPVV